MPTKRTTSARAGTTVKRTTPSKTGRKSTKTPPVKARAITSEDIDVAQKMRAYYESLADTTTLLTGYVELLDDLAARGASAAREKARAQLALALTVYRTQADYERMRAMRNAKSWALEYAFTRPLTETDRRNIKAAWALDKEIRALLGITGKRSKKRRR